MHVWLCLAVFRLRVVGTVFLYPFCVGFVLARLSWHFRVFGKMLLLGGCPHFTAKLLHGREICQDSLAEWSKALASGASPQGRGFELHSCHFSAAPVIPCRTRSLPPAPSTHDALP